MAGRGADEEALEGHVDVEGGGGVGVYGVRRGEVGDGAVGVGE